LATLINGKKQQTDNSNEFEGLIAAAEACFNNADEVLARFAPEMACA
jgi:hypothetical protein